MAPNPFPNFPTELILYVLAILAHDPDTGVQQRQRSIFAISQVDRQLRQIALATPHLWTNLHIGSGELNLELVQNLRARSAGLPFAISAEIGDLPGQLRWSLAYPVGLPPARSIVLHSQYSLPGSSTPVTALGSLSSSTTEHVTIVSNGYSFDCPAIPPMSNLLSIEVHRAWIALARDTQFTSVKRLRVRCNTRRILVAASFRTCFGALAALPNLEVLDLDGMCSYEYDAESSEHSPEVGGEFLAHLRSVRLSKVPAWFRMSLLSYCASSELERVAVFREIDNESPVPSHRGFPALVSLKSLEVDVPSAATDAFLPWITSIAPSLASITFSCKSGVRTTEIKAALEDRITLGRLDLVTFQEEKANLFTDPGIEDLRLAVAPYADAFKFVRACDIVSHY